MIELQGITKSFGTLQVLKGIDLMIEKGEGPVLNGILLRFVLPIYGILTIAD